MIVSIQAQTTYTNGYIYVDSPVECHLVSAHAGTLTNQLISGISYMTGNTLLEFEPSQLTTWYLSGGTIIIATANAKFSIDIFEQEILNLSDTPRRAKFGNYNLAITVQQGIVSILSETNEASAISLSAQESAFQLGGGKFVFDVSTNGIISYSSGDCKRIFGTTKPNNTNKKGAELLAQRGYQLTTTEIIQPSTAQLEMYNNLLLKLNDSIYSVDFFVMQGKLIGIWLK